MIRLTVELKPHVAEQLDSVVRAEWNEEPEDWTRCAVLVNLLLDGARQLPEGGSREDGTGQAQQPPRDDLESLRRERVAAQGAGGRARTPPPRPRALRLDPRQSPERTRHRHPSRRVPRQVPRSRPARRGRGASRPGARRSGRPRRPPPPGAARCGLCASGTPYSGAVCEELPRTARRRFAAETSQDVLSRHRRPPKPRLVPTLGKGPGGRLAQRGDSPFPPVRTSRPTHPRRTPQRC